MYEVTYVKYQTRKKKDHKEQNMFYFITINYKKKKTKVRKIVYLFVVSKLHTTSFQQQTKIQSNISYMYACDRSRKTCLNFFTTLQLQSSDNEENLPKQTRIHASYP